MKQENKWNAMKQFFSFRRKKAASAPTASKDTPLPEWKEKAMVDFSEWLEALPDTPPAAETATADSCDLYTLLSEFSALRQEIKLQNREQHRSIQTFTEMNEAYQKSMELFQKSVSDIDRLGESIREETEKKAILPFLDVRDALLRGRQAACDAIEKKRWYRPGPAGVEAIVEGYEMAIRRFDRALSYADIIPVQTTGQPFDPKTMKAIGKRTEPEKAADTVLEEQTGGFLKGDAVIRTAEVIVNKPQ